MYEPGIPLTKVQPAVVPDVMLEKLRPPTQSGIRSLDRAPALPLSLTFDPVMMGVKGVPVFIARIPVTCQPPTREETILGPCGEGRAQIPFTTKLSFWLSAPKPRSALVLHNWELVPSVG